MCSVFLMHTIKAKPHSGPMKQIGNFLKVISLFLWFCVFVLSPRQFAQLLREKATQTRQSETMPPCLFPPCLSWTSTLPCKGVFFPLVLLRNQWVTFYCHQASFRSKTEADVSDWCCCWSSFSFIRAGEQRTTLTAFLNEKDVFALLPSGFAKLELCRGLFATGQWHPVHAAPRASWKRQIHPPIQTLFFMDSFQDRVLEACYLPCVGSQPDHLWRWFGSFYSILQIFYTSHLTLMYRSADRLCSPQTVAVITTYKSKQCQVIISNPQGL